MTREPAEFVTVSQYNLGRALEYSVRYALGRRSPAVFDVSRLVLYEMNCGALSSENKRQIATDIRACRDYGDACDRDEWLMLLAAIEAKR